MSHKHDSKHPGVCASSCTKQQPYKTLHTPFTDARYIVFISKLFLKQTDSYFNRLSTFPLKQCIIFTRGIVPWLMLALSLIWSGNNKHFIVAYFSLQRKPRASSWGSLDYYCVKLFYHSSFALQCRRRNTSARSSRRRADTEQRGLSL